MCVLVCVFSMCVCVCVCVCVFVCFSAVFIFSPQDPEPKQDGLGCSGHLQFVLHAALAVRPVCAAYPGKHGARERDRERMWE